MRTGRGSGPARWRRGLTVVLGVLGSTVMLLGGPASGQRGQVQRTDRPGATAPGAAASPDLMKLHAGVVDTNLDNVVDNGKAMYRVLGLKVPAAQANAHLKVHLQSIQKSMGLVDEHLAHLKGTVVASQNNDALERLSALKMSWRKAKSDLGPLRTLKVQASGANRAQGQQQVERFLQDVTKADASFNELVDKLDIGKVESVKPPEPATSPATK